MAETKVLTCDMDKGCTAPIAYIDNKGFIYCAPHGLARRYYHPCRKLRPYELNRLRKGLPLTKY